jgi:alpha-D-xyloside xylohydrolase
MPYIYSLAGMTWFSDYTIMRAMIMDFADDKEVRSIGDQYMFGPSLLIAPVYRYQARTREVYFPASCGWYDFYTGKYIPGAQRLVVDAPYERIPLFVREGSIIPMGPEIRYTDEKPTDPLTLWVYTGNNCKFTLYEDEGTNYNYEKGAFSTIEFSFDNKNGILTIGERKGEFPGMSKSRKINVICITPGRPVSFDPETTPQKSVTYSGSQVIINVKD